MTFEIRPLTVTDAEAFIEMRRQALLDSPAAFGASPEDDRALSIPFVETMLSGEGESAVFGAFAPQLVGVAGIYRDEHRKTAHKAHLWGMFVSPPFRGQGVARQLLSSAIAYAGTLPGVTQVLAIVSEAAPGAKRLYESCGFRVWGVEPQDLLVDGRFYTGYHVTLLVEEATE